MMAGRESYHVELIPGHQIARRGLAFLISGSETNIDAKSVFDKLSLNREREVRTRFDYWLDGGTNNKWFHGWPNYPIYKDCFVFKWKERKQHHRFYGFLCNPLSSDPGFRLCVLVSHAKKTTQHTDPSELHEVNQIKGEYAVKEAIRNAISTIVPQPPK